DVGPRAYAFRYLSEPDRALIGVVLSSESRGARIDAVTPDSPADRAGLRSGDIMTDINGKALASAEPEQALSDARKRLSDLKDGEEVRVSYSRAGKAAGEVTLTAQRREAHDWQRLFAGEGDTDVRVITRDMRVDSAEIERTVAQSMREARKAIDAARIDAASSGNDASSPSDDVRRAMVDARKAMRHAEMARIESARHSMPWWGISLAALNPDLGRYFGSDSGVLVLSSSTDTLPELKAGDIIRKVADQVVTRPEDALRTLRDQPTGSTVKIDILRERKASVLNVKVPEYKSIFNVGRATLPPAPPAPPAAPNAPAGSIAPVQPDPPAPNVPLAPPGPRSSADPDHSA
ncbi:MAG: PDZ domain-containing protein, partial [Dokdonella sp.]